MQRKLLFFKLIFVCILGHSMEPELPLLMQIENADIGLSDDLFCNIEEWINSESEGRFSQEKLETPSTSVSKEISFEENEDENKTKTSKKQPCPVCHKLLLGLNLKRHIKMVHTNERPHKCTHCFKAFSYLYALEAHLKVHSKIDVRPKPYVCRECNEVAYASKGSLNKHVNIKHRQQPREYSCPWCSKICFQKSILEIHERTHTGNKPFLCTFCDYPFTQNGNLKRHILQKHPDSKPLEAASATAFIASE